MHQNLSYKIIAVLLAVALWFYVLLTEENPIAERRLSVPLHLAQTHRGLVVTGYPARVQVTVQGTKKAVAAAEGAILASFRLASVRTGEHEAAVELATPRELTVVRVQPPRVRVRVEPVAARSLRVEPRLLGNSPPGVVVGDPEVSPPSVRISGARSVVDQVAHAIANVKAELAGLEEGQIVAVVAGNEYGLPLAGLKIEPSRVRVKIPAERKLSYKTVPVTVRIIGLPEGQAIRSVVVEPAAVTVGGDGKVLATLSRLDAGSVSLAQASPPSYTTTLELEAPAGLLLLGAKRVQVRVSLALAARQENIQAHPVPE